MVNPAAGAVILVPFPYSNLTRTRLRPAIVLAAVSHDDWILCQVTSNPYGDAHAIELTDLSFSDGSLKIISYARPGKLFTASQELMVSQVGVLNNPAFQAIIEAVINILQASLPMEVH